MINIIIIVFIIVDADVVNIIILILNAILLLIFRLINMVKIIFIVGILL